MARKNSISVQLIELTANDGCWLYNESELCRNFVHSVTLGKDEVCSHWIECTDAEKRAYEEEQARLLGKDTDNAYGSINNPETFVFGEYVDAGKWYINKTYGLVECLKSGNPTADTMAEFFDLPPL